MISLLIEKKAFLLASYPLFPLKLKTLASKFTFKLNSKIAFVGWDLCASYFLK